MRITTATLTKRINRKLAARGEALRRTRGMQAYLELGDYYAIDISGNFVVSREIDLQELGRDLGVLFAHEEVAP